MPDRTLVRWRQRETYSLSVAPEGGTNVVGVHENLPPGVGPEVNEPGWRMSLDKLAALVEGQLRG